MFFFLITHDRAWIFPLQTHYQTWTSRFSMGESCAELTLFLWLWNKGIIISPFSVSPVLLWFFFFLCRELLSVQPLCGMSPQSIVMLRRWRGRSIACLLLYCKMSVLMEVAKGPKGTQAHKQTHTHRGQSPTLTACHLPSRSHCFIDIEMKIKACRSPRDVEQEGRVTYLQPSTLQHAVHTFSVLK